MRARDERVLAEGDAAAAVTADVGHDMSDLVGLAGGAALAGGGCRDLVLFAGHFGVRGCLVCEFGDGGVAVASGGGKDWRVLGHGRR